VQRFLKTCFIECKRGGPHGSRLMSECGRQYGEAITERTGKLAEQVLA
jgi:hypothetical protein